MVRSKYNVEEDRSKRSYGGVVFDSRLEMRYYRDVLRPKVESGEVTQYELQKVFQLQPGFIRNGKRVQPITYVADFYVEYADGRTQVIDTKGVANQVALLKRKMFWARYPKLDYQWITYVEKYGGWIEYETAERMRKEEKRMAKRSAKQAAEGGGDGDGKKAG